MGGSSGCHILAQRWYGTPWGEWTCQPAFKAWHLEVASTRHWGEWTCQTAFKAWRSALNSTRPGETIIYHYKPYFFSWNISRCGGDTPLPFWNISVFTPPPPTPPKRGDIYIYITQKINYLLSMFFSCLIRQEATEWSLRRHSSKWRMKRHQQVFLQLTIQILGEHWWARGGIPWDIESEGKHCLQHFRQLWSF